MASRSFAGRGRRARAVDLDQVGVDDDLRRGVALRRIEKGCRLGLARREAGLPESQAPGAVGPAEHDAAIGKTIGSDGMRHGCNPGSTW